MKFYTNFTPPNRCYVCHNLIVISLLISCSIPVSDSVNLLTSKLSKNSSLILILNLNMAERKKMKDIVKFSYIVSQI
jgi:hypothetical protein